MCFLSFGPLVFCYSEFVIDIPSIVAGCGVCHSDLHVIKGEIPFSSPCVIGHEITGEVVEHGPLTDHKTTERFYIDYLCFVHDEISYFS